MFRRKETGVWATKGETNDPKDISVGEAVQIDGSTAISSWRPAMPSVPHRKALTTTRTGGSKNSFARSPLTSRTLRGGTSICP